MGKTRRITDQWATTSIRRLIKASIVGCSKDLRAILGGGDGFLNLVDPSQPDQVYVESQYLFYADVDDPGIAAVDQNHEH